MLTEGVLVRVLPQARGLGRQLVLDGRSVPFMVEETSASFDGITDVVHPRRIPITQQGDLGACTGHAGTGALGTDPLRTVVDDRALTAEFANGLYSVASHLDIFKGAWPPTDTGSSGLAICKSLKERELVSGYRWARTLEGFAKLLQDGSVLVGTYWLRGMYHPDRDGFVWPSGVLDGGHEYLCRGVTNTSALSPFDWVFHCDNSWGPWGPLDGSFKLRGAALETLKRGRDLKQLVG